MEMPDVSVLTPSYSVASMEELMRRRFMSAAVQQLVNVLKPFDRNGKLPTISYLDDLGGALGRASFRDVTRAHFRSLIAIVTDMVYQNEAERERATWALLSCILQTDAFVLCVLPDFCDLDPAGNPVLTTQASFGDYTWFTEIVAQLKVSSRVMIVKASELKAEVDGTAQRPDVKKGEEVYPLKDWLPELPKEDDKSSALAEELVDDLFAAQPRYPHGSVWHD